MEIDLPYFQHILGRKKPHQQLQLCRKSFGAILIYTCLLSSMYMNFQMQQRFSLFLSAAFDNRAFVIRLHLSYKRKFSSKLILHLSKNSADERKSTPSTKYSHGRVEILNHLSHQKNNQSNFSCKVK